LLVLPFGPCKVEGFEDDFVAEVDLPEEDFEAVCDGDVKA
jgi:hypothetical protein